MLFIELAREFQVVTSRVQKPEKRAMYENNHTVKVDAITVVKIRWLQLQALCRTLLLPHNPSFRNLDNILILTLCQSRLSILH